MSWQSYVDDHLIGTGHVSKAAICGVDGALWAASAGFDVSADEVTKIVAGMDDASGLQAGGLYVGGEKWMFILSDDRNVVGKKGSNGLFVCKAGTCVVIGTHDENIQGGNCNTCVGNLADYLLNNGM
mmetsp:Transcript_16010/g.38972  ORF Transcript_16010/g.38972 Transcript_16010/m.38972 type:complete len:127 (-) Transcript_16010:197-577(-)